MAEPDRGPSPRYALPPRCFRSCGRRSSFDRTQGSLRRGRLRRERSCRSSSCRQGPKDLGLLWSSLCSYASHVALRAVPARRLWRALHPLAFCDRVGHRCFCVFRRAAHRRTQALAKGLAIQNVVGHSNWHFCRCGSWVRDRRPRPRLKGASVAFHGWSCRLCHLASRRHFRILGQAAFWPEGLKRPYSWARGLHGPARRLYRGCGIRRNPRCCARRAFNRGRAFHVELTGISSKRAMRGHLVLPDYTCQWLLTAVFHAESIRAANKVLVGGCQRLPTLLFYHGYGNGTF